MNENFTMKREWAEYEVINHLERFISSCDKSEKNICFSIIRALLELNNFEKWGLLEENKEIYDFVKKSSNLKILKLFFEYGITFDTEDLMLALKRGNAETATFLIDLGVDLNCTCENDFTPLGYLISIGYLNFSYFLIEKLLKKGANPNISKENILVMVLNDKCYNYKKVLKLLINYNADVSYNSYEAINYAAAKVDDTEVFDLLIDSPTAKEINLLSVFKIAVKYNNKNIIKYMLSEKFKDKEKDLVMSCLKTVINSNYKLNNFIEILFVSNVSVKTLEEVLKVVKLCKHNLRDVRKLKKVIKQRKK